MNDMYKNFYENILDFKMKPREDEKNKFLDMNECKNSWDWPVSDEV